jgi:hypothetical protein
MVLGAAEKLPENDDCRVDLDPKKYYTTGNLWSVMTSFDDTPLIWAAILKHESDNNRAEFSNTLSTLNIQNKQGFSALMKAAEQGHEEIVRCLLDRGADPTLKTRINNRDVDARKFAWNHAHVGVANIFFERDYKNGKKTKISDIFDEEE